MHNKSRLEFIDNAKAIGILLVLIGHTDGISEPFRRFIFSFHMPVFFFVSGFLLQQSKLLLRPIEFVRGQAKALVVPYFFFSALSLLYAIPNSIVKRVDLNLGKDVAGIMWGNADSLVNTVLWFFTCLFSTSLIHYLLAKLLSARQLLLASLVAGCVACYFYHPSMQRLPWNIDLAVVALSFYATGHYLSRFPVASYLHASITRNAFLLLIGTPILFFMTSVAGRVNMAYMGFGNPWLFPVNGYLGIFLLLIASATIPSTRIALFLSRNSIVIFPLHPIFFSLFTGGAIIEFGVQHQFQDNLFWALAYTIGAAILSFPVSLFLFKYCAFMLGRNTARLATHPLK